MTTATRIYERRWKMLAVLSLSMMIIGLDNTIVNVALPTLQSHFAASSSDLQWIVDAYLLVFAAALLTMGTLGDRYGRKRALQGGLVLFGGASAAEKNEAALQRPLAPVAIAERSHGEQGRGEDQQVGVDDPLQIGGRSGEVALQRGQRDVHDGVVEADDHHAQGEHGQHLPAACVDARGVSHWSSLSVGCGEKN